jgi:hypothetical protein
MTALLSILTAGEDTGPFDIYSNVDGFISAFEANVPKASLLSGYPSANIPNVTLIILFKSKGLCTNSISVPLV